MSCKIERRRIERHEETRGDMRMKRKCKWEKNRETKGKGRKGREKNYIRAKQGERIGGETVEWRENEGKERKQKKEEGKRERKRRRLYQ